MPETTCSVSNCERPVRARMLCSTHYARWSRTGRVDSGRAVRALTSTDGCCRADDCDRSIVTRGFCRKHYSRWQRHGDPSRGALTPEQRFWPHVATGPGCWEWTRARNSGGYGTFVYPDGQLAHRFSWIVSFGPIPDGLDVLHKCDNPPCVRPDHLFLGTDADNAADKVAKGRSYTYHGRGQKLTWGIVERIRADRAQGVQLGALAEEHGVTVDTVWRITSYRTWDPAKRHLSDM